MSDDETVEINRDTLEQLTTNLELDLMSNAFDGDHAAQMKAVYEDAKAALDDANGGETDE